MTVHVSTVAFQGIETLDIDLQVQISSGLVAFTIVGLHDKAVAGVLSPPVPEIAEDQSVPLDLSDIKCQETCNRALEIAATIGLNPLKLRPIILWSGHPQSEVS